MLDTMRLSTGDWEASFTEVTEATTALGYHLFKPMCLSEHCGPGPRTPEAAGVVSHRGGEGGRSSLLSVI